MPIGKNSIKRVTNNGYSKVKSEAPDMENSTEVKAGEVKTAKKSAPKKTAPKKAENKKDSTKKAESKKNAKPVEKKEAKPPVKKSTVKKTAISNPAPETMKIIKEENRPNGFTKSPLGSELPTYLL